MKPKFIYVSYIKTTPEKLWQALTSAEFSQQYWFGYKIESNWQVGSTFNLIAADGSLGNKGKILKYDEPKILSYTFQPQQNEAVNNELPSTVIFELEKDGELVKLTVTHFDFPEDSNVFPMIQNGWPAILSSLKSLLESGKALVFE